MNQGPVVVTVVVVRPKVVHRVIPLHIRLVVLRLDRVLVHQAVHLHHLRRVVVIVLAQSAGI